MIGVVSLSLAACGGGGDSTVQTQQVAPVVPPTVPPTPPAYPPLFGGGFTDSVPGSLTLSGLVANVVDQAAKEEFPIFSTTDTRSDSGEWIGNRIYAVQHMNANWKPGNRNAGPFPRNYGQYNTFIKLVPSGSADNINYQFEIYNHDNDRDFIVDYTSTSGGVLSEPLGHPPTDRGLWNRKVDSFDSTKYEVIPNKIDLGPDFDYTILKTPIKIRDDGEDGNVFYAGEEDGTFYAEVWTNYGSDTTDWMAGGIWLIVPEDNTDTTGYKFSAFALGKNILGSDFNPSGYAYGLHEDPSGEATYTGPATGLYLSGETQKLSRLLGKVSMTARLTGDIANEFGTLEGRITDLMLDDETLSGEILLPKIDIRLESPNIGLLFSRQDLPRKKQELGNIRGDNMIGEWGAMFTGDTTTTAESYPTGVVGTVGGYGGGNSFVASFGAKKVEKD